MASGFELEIPQDFLEKLLDHPFEDVAKKALEATAPTLEAAIKASMRSAVKHAGDSEMINSVRRNKPQQTCTDAWIVNVYPSGYSKNFFNRETGGRHTRKYPVSNALKAIWLNYGRSGQAKSPWLEPAVTSCQGAIMDNMQKIWEEETGANEY